MSGTIKTILLLGGATILPFTSAIAQTAEGGDSSEIVVTANKRQENINKVGLTVTALSGDALSERRLTSLEDVTSIVPGLSFAPSASNTPILTLRGVGFNETSLGVYPAVTVYIDQAPIVFPAMALHSAYDLQRVEVLKGPQGTLFGQNSTGGAINYIAAKPTDHFEAGGDITYGRFNDIQGNAYISGPLADTLRGRIAVTGENSDDWQKSYTRRDTAGHKSYVAGRMLLDWDASSALKFSLNVNGWRDKSQPQSGQLFATHEGETDDNPPRPGSAAVNDPLRNLYSPPTGGAANAELSYPFAPFKSRYADWSTIARDPKTAVQLGGGASDPTTALERDFTTFSNRRFLQTALRADLEVASGITLTSLTSYIDFKQRQALDPDGMALVAYNSEKDDGRIKTFNQELRLANDGTGALRWMVGGNYEDTKTTEDQDIRYFANGNYKASSMYINSTGIYLHQKIRNYAFFGDLEFKPVDRLTLKAAARYTSSRNRAININYSDPNGNVNMLFNYLGSLTGVSFTPTVAGDPYALNTTPIQDPHSPIDMFAHTKILSPTLTAGPLGTGIPGVPFEAILKEHNFSWRLGADFQATDDILLYANVSRGFKAGSFPVVAAASFQALLPVQQEKVTSYEVGVKSSMLDRKVQLNLAGFYYDYRNKQVRGKFLDPVFGLLDLLVNVPKSSIWGAEAELTVNPVEGLTLNGAITYLDAKIKSYVGYNVFGGIDHPGFVPGGDNTESFKGSPLPYTPKWAGSVNIDYRFNRGNGGPFIGATMNARSKQDSAIGASTTGFPVGPRYVLAPGIGAHPYVISGYATFDARLGYEGPDGAWRVQLWGKNLTNKYYITAVSSTGDQSVRYTGMPATYGVTIGFKMK